MVDVARQHYGVVGNLNCRLGAVEVVPRLRGIVPQRDVHSAALAEAVGGEVVLNGAGGAARNHVEVSIAVQVEHKAASALISALSVD